MANLQIIINFPLSQAMAVYPPSASRGPQPSSLSLLNQSDSSLCSTFLCSLVSKADSKSLLYIESETLDFSPSLQQTKPCQFSSSHISPLCRGLESYRQSVAPRAPSAASLPLSLTTAVSLSLSTSSCCTNNLKNLFFHFLLVIQFRFF